MKKKLSWIGAFAMSVIIVQSCSKDSEDNVTPPPTCSTDNIKYSTNILPIISSNCYACHGNGATTAGINVDGYANLKTLVDNGKLVGVVTHASGFTPMPYNKPKLSDCDINKIKAWVAGGALNN